MEPFGKDKKKEIGRGKGEGKRRLLGIFFRAMRGEGLSIPKLAKEYHVSSKTISRDIGEISNFLSEERDLVSNAELKYSSSSKMHQLEFSDFLLSKELAAVIEVLIGCRAFGKMEVLELIGKLKGFTAQQDREKINRLILKEMYHYNGVSHDCKSVIENLWKIIRCMDEKTEVTVSYYKANRALVERRIMPIALTFSDYYFYLIAYRCDKDDWKPLYYRVDRIVNIIEHRAHFKLERTRDFDEGELRSKIQFMQPGDLRRIKFSYEGPSVQAILDRIPTAKIIDIQGNAKIIEAETYGTGINMYLLSQGSMVQALEPREFVEEIAGEIERMGNRYQEVMSK